MMRDFVQSFLLSDGLFRGNVVRTEKVVREIVCRHNYPEVVSYLVAETTVLASLISSTLKYDGVFTLQIHGDGAVSTLVTDISGGVGLRSYARYDTDKVGKLSLEEVKERGIVPSLLQSGYVSFTVDFFDGSERYQGVVELDGRSIADSVLQYFNKSEQVNTVLKTAVDLSKGISNIKASGIILQQIPMTGGRGNMFDRTEEEAEEEWNTNVILLSSLKNEELLNEDIIVQHLLYMLYNEQDIRIFDEKPLNFSCRCSKERIKAVLASFSEHDFKEVFKDGFTEVTCEFCGQKYKLTELDFKGGDV